MKVLSMKTIYLFLSLSVIALQACSQSPSNTTPGTTAKTPATTPATATVKPKTPAYASAKEGWLVDLDEAYAVSKKEGKPILANFTGSDWCGWCKKLDADVFTKPEFQKWAKENVVLLELDFPRRFQIPPKNQQQNAGMKNALRVTGFPTIWVLNLTKDATSGQYQVNGLGKTGYTPSVEQFISTVDQMVN
jgi:protein disulfide-isomerase